MSLIACNKTCPVVVFSIDFFGIRITLRTFWWTWPHLRTLARMWAVLYLPQRRVCLGVASIRYLRVAILLLGTGLGQRRIGLPIPKTSDQCPARGRWLLSIFETKGLRYIGSNFTSYVQRGKGRPDLVFGNMTALAYRTRLQSGLNVGSDHIPITIKISTSAILNKERWSFLYKQAL